LLRKLQDLKPAVKPIRIGVIGLGRAFILMHSALSRDPRVQLVAAFDPRKEARAAFKAEFKANVYDSAEALIDDPTVELVYIASPHQHHAAHTLLAAKKGKAVLVEKPMAISKIEARAMVTACQAAHVPLIVGHSHSFDEPILAARRLLDTGVLGSVQMIQSLHYSDFMYRPRRPEELSTEQGGGVVYSQAAHQIDTVRYLAGQRLSRVRAATGNWDATRRSEGAYSALLWFDNGSFANLTYNGYGQFNSDIWCGSKELGQVLEQDTFGARAPLLNAANEELHKANRAYGGSEAQPHHATRHEHFGPLIISCSLGGLRVLPEGLWQYGALGAHFHPIAPPVIARQSVIDELVSVLRLGQAPVHSGEWGLETLAACEALLRSHITQRDIAL
jgi:phthalate 4,5-cis-dihydrodiol dehydrogenase